MQTFSDVYRHLRRKQWRQYALLAGCAFFSTLLITAYACMMRSPTILTVLPEGGDSRKQVMMVFVLAVLGCLVFTTYAAGLFFRQRSRELGIFLALGASRQQLKGALRRDLTVIALAACLAGGVLGAPLSWGVWTLFRRFLVDSQEMALSFDPAAYGLPLCFGAYVLVMLLFLASRSVDRTNILDIIQEAHKSEPIRAVKRWYGPVGLLLVAVGVALGNLMPSVFVRVFHWYAPSVVTGLCYAPALVGLYMFLLHTVVNGWGKQRGYKNLIATAMMKFQGRQTVRNMLVMTLLVAGAYFASFYAPMMSSSSAYSFEQRPVDYEYHWRGDQDLPDQDAVLALAGEHDVALTSWAQVTAATLGRDGSYSVERETAFGTTYTTEYTQLLKGATFFSESDWNTLTGQEVDLRPGTCANVLDDEGGSSYRSGGDVAVLTNMVTRQTLRVTPAEPLRYTMLLGCYVLDDGDYAAITQGLTELWTEEYVFFNVADVEASYPFAKALFQEIIACSGPEVEVADYYDLVGAALAQERGEPYAYDPQQAAARGLSVIDYDDSDSSEFRAYWLYMPQFRVLDQNDFATTMAVFLMLFIFIALVCFAAVIVIAFTRSMTLALTNARVYDDLRRLGAPPDYLYRTVKGQVSRVFQVPILVGTVLIYAFYGLIMYTNSQPAGITASEGAGMLTCLAVVAGVTLLLYLVYRLTLRQVCAVTIYRKGG